MSSEIKVILFSLKYRGIYFGLTEGQEWVRSSLPFVHCQKCDLGCEEVELYETALVAEVTYVADSQGMQDPKVHSIVKNFSILVQ